MLHNIKSSGPRTMDSLLCNVIVLLLCVMAPVVLGVGGPPPGHMVYDDHHDHDHGVDSRVMDENYEGNIDEAVRMDDVRRNVEHLKEHIRGVVGNADLIDPETATKQELDWYFFNVHDTNDDMKLDGLELLQSMGHALHHQVDQMREQGVDALKLEHRINRANNHFIRQIDRILEKEDINQDGYLTYVEYAKARSVKMILQNADKMQRDQPKHGGWY